MSTPLWEPTSDTPHVCASSKSLSALSPAWDPSSDLSYLVDNPALPVATSSAPSTSTASNEFSIATRRAEFTKRMAALHTSNVNTLPPPETRKEAMWHPQSGLFVSPNATYIPRIEPNDVRRPNPSIPRILPDDEFFLAFRPRIIRNSGILFGRLNMSNASLAKAVVSATGGYMLDPFVLESWLRLENAFLDLCDSLLPKSDVPLISYPVFPYERGYRHTHRSRDAAVRCAIRSRDAFIELSSLVSFIIALNMDKDGSYEGAFYKLRTRQYHPVHSAWLDLLKISQVCDFSDNARVGVVVNPYTSRWGFPLFKFFLARVPIWFFWGHNHRDTLPSHTMYNFFLPPDNIVEKAFDLAQKSTNLILPSYRFDPYESSASTQQLGQDLDASPYVADTYTPQSPTPFSSPPVSTPPSDWSTYEPSVEPLPLNASDAASSRDKALAALEEFFAGCRKRREDKMKVETMKERQSRESMEAYAKSRDNFSSTSTVYEWVKDDNGNYERTKVDSNPAVERWGEFKKNQRRYTFPNQWDLCPQLPKYSAEFPEEDDNDNSDLSDPDESDDPDWKPMGRIVNSSASRSLAIPANGTSDTLLDLQVIHCTEASETHEPTPAEISELAPFLRDRIGYAMPTGWSIRVPEKRDDMPPPQSTSSSSRRKVTPSSTSSRGEMGKMKGPAKSLPNHSLSLSREEVGYKRRREETERLPSRPTSSYLPDGTRATATPHFVFIPSRFDTR
ncbi:hypothetical protein BDN70DRAFT_939881 [Pholiota conissans]|uniref:Uncharacterized protein n=1 Tax=Pholiota conissans TaxID=109636 RepID=A0A9P5YI11_9AGAR|nr:hypothetical protein BDN70DRAFT_939881 [Pholiota conissans]